jgi:two-component system, response regulator PdtaR
VRQANILIVDDDAVVRLDLREVVTGMGHVVVGEAGSGSQALALVRNLRPNVVLLDIVLPTLSGLEVARAIVAERLAAVILVTGASDGETLTELDSSGAMAFLSKPLRETDLRGIIPIALARHRERLALEEEVKSLNERMEARKLVGRAKAILMERQNLSEREAFRRIQSQSISLNKPVHEIAKAIITASEFSVEGPVVSRPATASATTGAAAKGATHDQDRSDHPSSAY